MSQNLTESLRQQYKGQLAELLSDRINLHGEKRDALFVLLNDYIFLLEKRHFGGYQDIHPKTGAKRDILAPVLPHYQDKYDEHMERVCAFYDALEVMDGKSAQYVLSVFARTFSYVETWLQLKRRGLEVGDITSALRPSPIIKTAVTVERINRVYGCRYNTEALFKAWCDEEPVKSPRVRANFLSKLKHYVESLYECAFLVGPVSQGGLE